MDAAVDIQEESDKFVIHADIPGVDPKDIEITLDRGVLSIAGLRKAAADNETGAYARLERSYGSFYRRFTLPDVADAENVGLQAITACWKSQFQNELRRSPSGSLSIKRRDAERRGCGLHRLFTGLRADSRPRRLGKSNLRFLF